MDTSDDSDEFFECDDELDSDEGTVKLAESTTNGPNKVINHKLKDSANKIREAEVNKPKEESSEIINNVNLEVLNLNSSTKENNNIEPVIIKENDSKECNENNEPTKTVKSYEEENKFVDKPNNTKEQIPEAQVVSPLPQEEEGKPLQTVEAEDDLGENDGWNIDEIETETVDESSAFNKDQLKSRVIENNTAENKNIEEVQDLWGDEDSWDVENTQKTIPTKKSGEQPQNIAPEDENSAWSSWGNWGINTVISTAANITSTVSHGLTNVLETGIGLPEPEELARLHKQLETDSKNTDISSSDNEIPAEEAPSFGFVGNWVPGVSQITKLVETTGSKVISGGLDTLETIGKKTMEVLQENDPGLKKKRAFLRIESDKPVLSQILREAKERAEIENEERAKLHVSRKANYETIFDDFQGLVHLEALEMLSKQCDIKLQSFLSGSSGSEAQEIQETMDQIRELCELDKEEEDDSVDFQEIKEKIDAAVADIHIPITYAKLFSTWDCIEKWIAEEEARTATEIHRSAIENLAQITAVAMEQFHKAGELLLVKERRSTADEADSLVQLTTSLSSLITILSNKYTEKLKCLINTDRSNSKEVNELITNIFLEAANSCRYVEDAFQLLTSVIQIGAV